MSPQLYAHLLPAERLLWSRWLLAHEREWDRFDYDIRVGRGRPVDPRHPPEIQAMAATLTKKRIDAVGFRGAAPTLFEVNPRGTRVVFGALQLYQDLYAETFAYQEPIALAAVVGAIDPDLLRVMTARGITVYVLAATAEPL